jgi:hypothetical protein
MARASSLRTNFGVAVLTALSIMSRMIVGYGRISCDNHVSIDGGFGCQKFLRGFLDVQVKCILSIRAR